MIAPRAALTIVLAGAALSSGCAHDAPDASPFGQAAGSTPVTSTESQNRIAEPHVVEVASQGCERPRTRRGVATFVADGIVLTAGHVVAGDLRRLEIDGLPGRVVAIDERRDLALVQVDRHDRRPIDGRPIDDVRSSVIERLRAAGDVIGTPVPGESTMMGPGGTSVVNVTRVLTLRVDDLSAGMLHERDAIELDRLVDRGDSGTPVFDATGRLIGVVVLRRAGTGTSFASVPPADLTQLIGDVPLAGPPGCV